MFRTQKKEEIDSLAHTRWNCKYHIVFAPKYRRQAIYGQIRTDIGSILWRCNFCAAGGVLLLPIAAQILRCQKAFLLTTAALLAFARKTTAGSTEIANQSSDRKTKQPRLTNKYYSCWSAIGSTAFTLPVCTETVSSFFPRKLSPRSLNTVASSKMRSSAHRSVESSLKSSRQRAGFLLLVKTMLKLPSLL